MGSEPPHTQLQVALDELDNATGAQARLSAARRIHQLAEALELAEVASAREHGTSWSKIGAVYGLTKQGAQQRFRRDAPKETGA